MGGQFDFRGAHLFVAGGTSGINLGIAEGFARAGAKVTVLSRSQEKVEAAVGRLLDCGAEAQGFAADVRNYEDLEQALIRACDRFGAIRVLVSGAAGNFPAAALNMSPNAFRSVVDIDLLGTYHVARAAFPLLEKPGAVLLNISAPQAQLPMALQAHVCAAKAGVDMLTRVLAMEWGGSGVRVNSLIPGPIRGTEGMSRLAPDARMAAAIADSVPLGRLGEVADLANAAMLLASPAASFITGAVLPVDGGWSLAGASAAMHQLSRSALGD